MDNMDANRLNAERLLLILECTGQKIDDYLHGKHNSARVLGAALKTIRAELRIWRERGYKIDLPEVAAGYADFGSSKAFSSKPATDLVDGREPWNRDGRTQASVHPVS